VRVVVASTISWMGAGFVDQYLPLRSCAHARTLCHAVNRRATGVRRSRRYLSFYYTLVLYIIIILLRVRFGRCGAAGRRRGGGGV
jgi:hypothetical protein